MFNHHPRSKHFLSNFIIVVLILMGIGSNLALAQSKLQPDPNAQLPIETLQIKTSGGEYSFTVEVADTPSRRSKGLMFRENMVPTHGMIFDFEAVEPVAMWMKNTPLPLDMLFIRPDGKIARIAKNTVPFSESIITSGEPISHVLEINAGISTQLGLKRNDVIKHRFFKNSK